ncbi:MAG: cysteine dioxygenase family protein [Xanthomonadaceae bacterium]|nr:cysteine dioxygenase family protein [Xanthomonadaceae bacterium]
MLQTIDACLQSSGGVDVDALRHALMAAFAEYGRPAIETVVAAENLARYCRIPLSISPDRDYSALVIAWPPGYATDIHDHSGLWGMLMVLDGKIGVENYSFPADQPESIKQTGEAVLDVGASAGFSIENYAHRCRNTSTTEHALSLHVYGGDLKSYRAFIRDEKDAWRVEPRRGVLNEWDVFGE